MISIIEKIIYGFFFVQASRWGVSLLWYFFAANDIEKHFTKIELKLWDNIFWIAPLVYFSGGLK
jgi:hypothetical protein